MDRWTVLMTRNLQMLQRSAAFLPAPRLNSTSRRLLSAVAPLPRRAPFSPYRSIPGLRPPPPEPMLACPRSASVRPCPTPSHASTAGPPDCGHSAQPSIRCGRSITAPAPESLRSPFQCPPLFANSRASPGLPKVPHCFALLRAPRPYASRSNMLARLALEPGPEPFQNPAEPPEHSPALRDIA